MQHELSHPISKTLLPVVAGMCCHPDQLEVWERDHGSILEIRFVPNMADIRIMIGKMGRQSKALKYVATSMAERMHIGVDLQIEESLVGDRTERRPFQYNPAFDIKELWSILDPVLKLSFGREVARTMAIENAVFKIRLEVNESELNLACAVGDIFYPYGIAHGRKIEIKPANYKATFSFQSK